MGKFFELKIIQTFFFGKLCATLQAIAEHMENYSLSESRIFSLTDETKFDYADSSRKPGEAAEDFKSNNHNFALLSGLSQKLKSCQTSFLY